MVTIAHLRLKGQEPEKIDTETMQTIFVQTIVFCYHKIVTEYTSRIYAGMTRKYSVFHNYRNYLDIIGNVSGQTNLGPK